MRLRKYFQSKHMAIEFKFLNTKSLPTIDLQFNGTSMHIVAHEDGNCMHGTLEYTRTRYNPHSYDSKDELGDIGNVNIVNLFTGNMCIRTNNRSLPTLDLMNILVEDVLSSKEFENDLPTFINVIIAKLRERNTDLLEHVLYLSKAQILPYLSCKPNTAYTRLAHIMNVRYAKICKIPISFIRTRPMAVVMTPESIYGKAFLRNTLGDESNQTKTMQAMLRSSRPIQKTQECGICFSAIYPNSYNTLKLSCGHIHHFTKSHNCLGIQTWFNSSNTCPYCREKIFSFPERSPHHSSSLW